MYDLILEDYKALLDMFTSLVNVKSVSAFFEMIANSKEQLGFSSVSMTEVEFHKTCTHKLLYSDVTVINSIDGYIVSPEDYAGDKIFPRILSGEEIIATTEIPAFAKDIFIEIPDESGQSANASQIHIFSKLNKETMTAFLLVFVTEKEEMNYKFRQISGYLHAHLMSTFVRVMSVSDHSNGKLSERELSVLTWLKYGKTSWEIAKILSITENTVNFHIKNIKNKLNATNRQHAVAIALAKNIIE